MTASAPLVTSPLVRPDPQRASRFLKTLHKEICVAIVPEMELTMKVAIWSASGFSKAEIVRISGASDLEIKMAFERLKKIAEGWK